MVKRFSLPFKSSVGSQRLTGTSNASFEAATRNTRTDMKRVIKNLTAFVNHLEKVSPEILYEALKPTFRKSQEYVPYDTGVLFNSGYLIKRKFRSKSIVEMGYAKGGIPGYAALQHENLEFAHKAPTQAKFLQRPIEEDSGDIQKRIIAGYKEASSV